MSDSQILLEGLLRQFPEATLRVSGRCLEPRIGEGERVRLRSSESCPPRFGDVVLTRQPQGLRLHRLVWAVGDRVRTQADNGALDPALRRLDILATVVGVEGRARPRDPARAAFSLLISLARAIRGRFQAALGA
jgi:hypothetical protein